MENQMNGQWENGSAKRAQAASGKGSGLRSARMVVLPWGKSMEIAIRSIRVRFFRSLITTLTLVLAIAFFSYVRVNAVTARGMVLAHDSQALEWLQARGYDSDDGSMDPGVNPRDRWILFLSLLVCVVGIVNTQLMAVTERFRDIGTMKCLGALDRFILRLFLIEAALQGLLGAALGAVLGAGISVLGTLMTFGARGLEFILWPGLFASLGTALALGCCLSLLGVLYPALLAARMRPVEAMRGKD